MIFHSVIHLNKISSGLATWLILHLKALTPHLRVTASHPGLFWAFWAAATLKLGAPAQHEGFKACSPIIEHSPNGS